MSRTKRENSEAHPQHSPQTFPLAHPPPKSKSKTSRQCLRLSSRLLLQIQQLTSSSSSNTTRAIPILELYHPSTFGKSVVNGRKLHSRDMYLTQSEAYTHLRKTTTTNGHENGNGSGIANGTKSRSGSGASSRRKSKSSADSSGEEDERKVKFKRTRKEKKKKDNGEDDEDEDQDIVAVIYTSPKPKSKTTATTTPTPTAELYFPSSQLTLEASSPSPGRYRFQVQSQEKETITPDLENGLVFEWENRPPSRSSPNSGSSSEKKDDDDRFVLAISGGATSLRRGWLAQLTRRGLHVGSLDAWQRELRALMIDGEDGVGAGLYTAILTMGVWVARGEGWLTK
ncbi:hypothetical protein BDW59DRAFT_56984 [Aspergillus cavernicola]|uniref:Uncharacterized protein n=1 Tax=Aspergillus cavernicola TaxID=176166 RepID=A0ABR4IHY4_9EURO